MTSKYKKLVNQIMADCKALDYDNSKIAVEFIKELAMHDKQDIKLIFNELSNAILDDIKSEIKEFKQTGEYYIVSNLGMKDISSGVKKVADILEQNN